MTTIKNAPLMAFVLGLGLLLTTVTMSSFKANQNASSKMVNPQWFTYNLDPNDANFASDKLIQTNYTATGQTNPSTRPCPSASEFCSIYAETVSSTQPDLSSTQPVRAALNAYFNGKGDETLIDEQN